MQLNIISREKKYISWDYRDLCKSSRGLVIRVSLFHLIQSQAFAKPGDWLVWREGDTGPVSSNCGAARSVRRGWLTHEIHILVSQDLYPAIAKHRECFAWHEDTMMKLILAPGGKWDGGEWHNSSRDRFMRVSLFREIQSRTLAKHGDCFVWHGY